MVPGKRFGLALLLCAQGHAQALYQFHGYLQTRFTDQPGTPQRLEIRRARLSVSGDLLPKLSYAAQGDFAKAPYLMDAALTWKFAPALRVTAGQFKLPFSAENLISDNLNAPIARSRPVLGLVPRRDTGVQGRDAGIQFAGALGQRKVPLVEYAVGVFRGQTLVLAPNAHYPAIVGRVMLHPVAELTVGGDWYGSFSAPAHGEKRREEVEGAWDRGRLHIRAEQIWARDGKLERRGGYVLGAWRWSSRWEPLVRADWMTKDIHKADTASVAYLAGLNFYWGKHVKVGADTGAQRDEGPNGLSSVFLAQVLLGF